MVSSRVVSCLLKAGLLHSVSYGELSRLYKSDFMSARKKTLQDLSKSNKVEVLAREKMVSCTGIVQDYWLNVHRECGEEQKMLCLVQGDSFVDPRSNSLFDLVSTGYMSTPKSVNYVITTTLSLDSILPVLAPVTQKEVRAITPYYKLSYRIMHDMNAAKNLDALRWICSDNDKISEFFSKIEWYVSQSSIESDAAEIPSAIKYCILHYATSLIIAAGDVLYRDVTLEKGKLVVKAQSWDSLLVSISGYEPPKYIVVDGIPVSVVKCNTLESYAHYLSVGV